jgi:hypothetical protein
MFAEVILISSFVKSMTMSHTREYRPQGLYEYIVLIRCLLPFLINIHFTVAPHTLRCFVASMFMSLS